MSSRPDAGSDGSNIRAVHVTAIDGSPSGGGRTERVLRVMLDAAEAAGAKTDLLSLATTPPTEAVARLGGDERAYVLASPVYRGSYAAPLKAFLDVLPRGMWGEKDAPITARPVALVLTGATWHHYLALADLRGVLAGFFAAHVLSPGVYVPAEGFDADKELIEPFRGSAQQQASALVELAAALTTSPALAAIRPQA